MNNTALVSRAQQKMLALVCTLSFVLGLLYVFVVRPGLPYDEPAHWNNVTQSARGNFLPVMGARGVSYEAYQGPFFYAVAGIVSRLSGMAGETFAFYFLRVASLALLVPITLLCYATARHVFARQSHEMALLVAIFIGWNPVLLAISASVQNDSLAILLSTLVIFLCVQKFADADSKADDSRTSSTRSSALLTARDAVLLGFLVGIAVLCKLTNAYLILAVPLAPWLARREEKRRVGEWLQFTLIFAFAVAITTFWWFAHNRALYGDFTGTSAMRRFFPEGTGTPLDFTKPHNWLHVTRSILNYWWLNAEYFRNLIEAPKLAKLALLFITTLAFLGFASRRITRRKHENSNLGMLNLETSNVKKGVLDAQSRVASRLVALFYAVCVMVYLRGIATQ